MCIKVNGPSISYNTTLLITDYTSDLRAKKIPIECFIMQEPQSPRWMLRYEQSGADLEKLRQVFVYR